MSICRAKVKIYMCMGSAAAISQPVSNTSGSFTEKQPHDVAHLRWGCVGIVTKTTHRSATRSYLMFRRGVADVWVHPPPLWRLVDSGGLVRIATHGALSSSSLEPGLLRPPHTNNCTSALLPHTFESSPCGGFLMWKCGSCRLTSLLCVSSWVSCRTSRTPALVFPFLKYYGVSLYNIVLKIQI